MSRYLRNRLLAASSILTVAGALPTAKAETLAEKLEARAAQGSPKLTPEIKEAFKEGIAAVEAAMIVEKAKQVGDDAPDFTLKNATGKDVTLSAELKKGPVVLTWYRGGWCPYCNIALRAMQEELSAFKEAGASLLALTPELPDKALSTTEKNELEFEVLTDLNHKVAMGYGLVFELTPEVERLYGQFFNLETFNGEEAGTNQLPLAATYVIGTDGKILWSFLHHDYRKRAEPKDIVAFLKAHKAEAPH